MAAQKTNRPNSNYLDIDFKEVVLYCLKYWKWFLLSTVVCIGIAVFYLKYKEPVYSIHANIVIKTDESNKGSMMESTIMKAVGMDGLSSSVQVEDEIGALGSQSLMRGMIAELNLSTNYTYKTFPFDKDLYKSTPVQIEYDKVINDTLSGVITFRLKVENEKESTIQMLYNDEKIEKHTIKGFPATLKTKCGTFTFVKNANHLFDKKESYKLEIYVYGLNYLAELYRTYVDIYQVGKKSNIIGLSIFESNRQKGKDILDKLIELYNIDALEDKNKNAENSASFVTERITEISKDLDVIERNVESFKIAHKISNPEIEAEIFLGLAGTITEKNMEVEIQNSLVAMIEDFLRKAENRYSLIPLGSGLPEAMATVVQEYNLVVLERDKLLRNTGENNPAVLDINSQIDLMRNNVYRSISQVKKDLASTKKELGKKQSEINSRIGKLPTEEREILDLYRKQRVKSEIYMFLLQKLEEAKLTLASNTPKAKIIDNAYSMFKPVAPKKMYVLAFSLVLGLLIPGTVIFLIKIFKFKLVSKAELESETSIPVIGEICLDKSGQRIVIKEGETSSTAELFRLLRSNLQFVLKKGEKVILVTSSISGEGKSFFTTNLALSFSMIKDKRVVIVGLDIRRPKLAEYVGVKVKYGITNYLSSDDLNPEDIIIPLSQIHPRLSLVPSGIIPPNPSELLLSDRLEKFFDYLRANFDFIIVDTAPVGMVSDTFVLDRISDMTLYLFRANYTNKSNLKFAENIVAEKKLKRLSLVMNGTTTKSAYGYGYNDNKK